MPDPITTISLSTLLKHGTVAFFGAIVHALSSQRNGTSKGFIDFIVLTTMSSFSGAMFAFVALHIFGTESVYLTLAMAGAGGYLGVEGMTVLLDRLKIIINGVK